MKRTHHDKQDLLWLSRTIRGTKRYILLLTLVRALMGIAGVGYAVCLRLIVDGAVSGVRAAMLRGVFLLVFLLLVQLVLQAAGRFLNDLIVCSVENKLKLRLLDNLLRKDYAQVTGIHSGEWMNRMTTDTNIIAGSTIQILPGAANMAARLVASAWMLLVLVPTLTVYLLVGGLAVVVVTWWMRKILKRMHKRIREADGALRVFLTERLGSLMILKAYQQEEASEARADDLMRNHKRLVIRRGWFSNFCNSGFTFAMYLALAMGAAYCGFGILTGALTYGTFTAVIQLIGQLQTPIANLTGFIPQYFAMLASVERLMESESFPDGVAHRAPAPREADFLSFGMDHLSYTYPSSDEERHGAVTDFSMEVRKGEYVAFAGPSGCGKSTVLKLLLCLYDPDSGTQYVRTPTGTVPLTGSWNQLFAYVPQGNHLMSGTIREVVSFADPDRADCDDAIYAALEAACAREFVEQLPLGLETRLGERGSGLSEGQMQRLAIARALFSDRPVLLLDESTSALDADSEIRLLQNIRALTGKTVIIVTHRPAALEVVDKVISFSPTGDPAPAD